MNEDKVINKLVEHGDRLARIEDMMATKGELSKFREEMLSGQDAIMTVLKRLDEERVFTHKWVKEIEEEVEMHREEIKKIKLQLKIA